MKIGIGLTLGGGYSWKSQQYGLSIDTIVSIDLVLPSGDLVTVTDSSHPGLFWGLKVNIFVIHSCLTHNADTVYLQGWPKQFRNRNVHHLPDISADTRICMYNLWFIVVC